MEAFRYCLGRVRVTDVPITADCVDGFLGAYWRRAAAYLEERVRAGMSSFSRIPTSAERLDQLRVDLESGAWQRANSDLLACDSLELGYKLITAILP